ncbi:hypothetical protein ISTM_282 [Insectomime virus]|nr:hypothetical protein ISTM_282 [Insectomime virus]
MERFLEYQERVSLACVFPVLFPTTEDKEIWEEMRGKTVWRVESCLAGTETRHGKSLRITRTPKRRMENGLFVSCCVVLEERYTCDNGEISGMFWSSSFLEKGDGRTKICENVWLYSEGERVRKY